MHYLIKKLKTEKGNLFSIISTTAVTITASFLLMLAFGNLLDPNTLGVYQYIVSAASIISSVSLTGANTAIIRAVGKKDYSFFPVIFKYTLYSFIVTSSVALVISSYYWYRENYILAVGILFPTILILLTQYQSRYNSIYIGIEEFAKSNVLLKAFALGPVFVLLPALFFIKDPAILAILFFGSSAIAVSLVVWYYKMPQTVSNLVSLAKPNIVSNKKYLAFSIHQSIITLFNSTTAHLDKIIVFQMLGAQATAIYFISVSIPDRLRGIMKQFDSYLFSKFSKHTHASTTDTLAFKLIVMLIAIIPFYIGYLLLAPLFFSYFLNQYPEAVPLTLIYGLTIFAGAVIIPQSALRAHAESKVFYIISVIYGTIRISSLVIGIYYFGMVGAIWAATISIILFMIINYAATFYKLKNIT